MRAEIAGSAGRRLRPPVRPRGARTCRDEGHLPKPTRGGRDLTLRCDTYEEFPDELVLYDAAAEVVASIPRERVVEVA
ncbi:hypothetical protein ACFQE1_15200, partial [Halobium palmae]